MTISLIVESSEPFLDALTLKAYPLGVVGDGDLARQIRSGISSPRQLSLSPTREEVIFEISWLSMFKYYIKYHI